MKSLGVYVHIPFCQKKCHYCDFVSYPGRSGEEITAYLAALSCESRIYARRYANDGDILAARSLYIGGGTPTCLTGGQLLALFGHLREFFQLPEGIEITVEANPGTLQREKLERLKEMGCNRLSFGVQSFSDHELRVLGRIHTSQDAVRSFALARETGFQNINLDLMYGLPGQSLQSWRNNLRQAVELKPEHLSLYQLNIEKGTPFARLVERGLLTEFDQDEAYAMYCETIEYLQEKGYVHYEISNFALPGRESFHNQIYWRNEEYLGLGAGAAGFLQGKRYRNTANLVEYLERLAHEKLPLSEKEKIDAELSMAETMFLGLRMLAGVNKERFRQKHGIDIWHKYGHVLDKLLQQGLLRETVTEIALSRKGLYVANLVMQEFL